MESPIQTLISVEPKSRVKLTLTGDKVVEGYVSPVRYDPGSQIRLEISTQDRSARYEVLAECTDGVWSEPVVRKHQRDRGWTKAGPIDAVEVISTPP